MMGRDYSYQELMAVAFARDLADGERGAAGMNALVPCGALFLARRLHAPNLTLCGELSVNPLPSALRVSVTDSRTHHGREAVETFLDVFAYSHGGLDFWFHNGLQIDAYGNVNLHAIGSFDQPDVRGPGLGNVSFGVTADHFYLYPMRHDARLFVEQVDFISVPGNLTGPESKRAARINTSGPRLCVSPMAIMDFDPTSLRMRLRSVHEGYTTEDVLAATGFELLLGEDLHTTPAPSKLELETLRREVDPLGLLRADG
jgi:glutaconate CoA-transferase subunit B